MLRRRFRGDGGDVAREAQCRATFGHLVGRHIGYDEALARARKRPLEEARQDAIPIGDVNVSIRRRTTPRQRPKDVAETKEASVDGTGFAKACVARSWLRRARPIRPFGPREVDERERAREPILAVVPI